MAKAALERDPALLLDMLLSARDAQEFVDGMDQSAFLASSLHQNAVARALEIIGEAASKVSATTRDSLPDIPWGQIVSMRNRLIHGYESIDLDLVWRTVQSDLPPLIARPTPLIPQE